MNFCKNNRINVLHLIYSLEVGGAENILYLYAKYHNKSRYHLEVCTFKSDGRIFEDIESLGIKIHCLKSSSSSLGSFFKLTKIFNKGSFQIAHFHNPLPVFWGIPAAFITRVPVKVLTEHSINYKGRIGKWSGVYSKLRKTMDMILACSEEVRRSHIGDLDPIRFLVVYNGVDIEKFSPGEINYELRRELGIPDESLVIGNIGNLTPQKGQSILLEAIRKLILEGIPVFLIVVGEGPLRESLELKAKDLSVSERVRFLGYRSDMSELLRVVDIVAGSSLREGFPVSVLEAMASAKPVVTTDVGGNREAIIDGVTGIIVPPGNSEELSVALKKLLMDSELREKMGLVARQRVEERFSVQHMVKRTEDIYESLLNSKHLA